MAAMNDSPVRIVGTPGAKLLGFTLTALSMVVLGSTLLLGLLLTVQMQNLGQNVRESQELSSANLRPLTQVQREVLRLAALLGNDGPNAGELELERSFVSLRAQEAALPSQIYALGSEALLQTSRDLRDTWLNEIEPLVRQVIEAPESASRSLRDQAINSLGALERGYNQLIMDGELNRRLQSLALNESARNTLNSAALLLIVLAASAAAFLILSVIAAISFPRIARQRAIATQALLQANRELRKLSAVASLTNNQVILTDAAGRIEWVNAAFVAQTGYALNEIRGQRPGDILQGAGANAAVNELLARKMAAGESVETEFLNYTRAGREYWIAIEARPTFDDEGNLANYVAIGTDVTARKQTEAALRTALQQERELRALKSRFVIMASHEFRTPLTTILSIATFLKMAETSLSAAKRIDRLTRLEAAAQQIESLIEDVLAYDETDTAWMMFDAQPVDLAALTRETVEMLRAGAGARYQFISDLPEGPMVIQADRKLLRQILSNLLSNAIKYSEPGSTVEVQARCEAGRVRVCVRDHGIGIPPGEQKRIFEPFFRAGNTGGIAGTGLGLSILRNAVELHGGEIQFESAEGQGTTFTVLLSTGPAAESDV